MRNSTSSRKILHGLLAAAFWIGIWWAASAAVGKELILPSPPAVVRSLAKLIPTKDFWQKVGLTLIRMFLGYVIGVAAGTALAAASFASKVVDALVSPLMRLIRATPVASFIILALLWMGKNWVPVLMAALMAAPIVYAGVCSGIGSTDPALEEMTKAFRVPRMRRIWHLTIPSALPSFRSAALTAIGLSWKAGIAAEVLSQPKFAMGTELYYARVYLETADLFAWTAMVILLSFLFEKAAKAVFRRDSIRKKS